MKIVIPEDYQNAVSGLNCFSILREHEVVIFRDRVTDPRLLANRLQDAEALVLIRERTAITGTLLDRLPRLKAISQTGRGYPHIDVDACTAHGVAVMAGGGSPSATAELTWGLVLAAMRHIPEEANALKTGIWQTSLGLGLRGRTLGIFGYGKIGSVVAEYGRVFGMNVMVWGREGSLSRAAQDGFLCASSQRHLFEVADVLSLHLKLTAETRHIVSAADLAVMKSSALLVNTSRADLIAPGALVDALQRGHPGQAAIDVYEDEPAIGNPLLQLSNALCTPHLGYVEKDSYEQLFSSAFENLLKFYAGNYDSVVNPAALKVAR